MHNSTLTDITQEAQPYINTLVIINYDEIVRLVGITQDELDYYWVYDSKTKGIQHSSCVMNFIPLKGFIESNKYNQLVKIWNLNNKNKVF